MESLQNLKIVIGSGYSSDAAHRNNHEDAATAILILPH